jgi:hypothetical protein
MSEFHHLGCGCGCNDRLSDQGNPIEWFSPHQRAILAGMSYVELQILVRHCRRPMDAESQQVEQLKADCAALKERLAVREAIIEEQQQRIRILCAELEVLKAMR